MSRVTRQTVPLRALIISVAALAVPVTSVFLMPDWTQGDQGMLIWLAALVPAFMLSYYRGMQGVAIALAGGMAVITATQVSIVAYEIADPNWNMLFAIVAVYLVIAISIGGLSEALLRRARDIDDATMVDQLTGLANGRRAEMVLRSEFEAAIKHGKLAVALFDLDDLKAVNTEHGHFEGDALVKTFGEVLQENIREPGRVARFRNELFLAVMPGGAIAEAVGLANSIRDGIKSRPGAAGSRSVSVGVAAYQPGMGSWEVMIAAAQRALEAAKKTGRDRVVMAPEFPGRLAVSCKRTSSPLPALSFSDGVVIEKNRTRILVVDDDDQARRSVVGVLRSFNFQTVDTNDPDLAIELAARGDSRLDLLVTDILMPRIDGLTMAERILEYSPDTRIVYLADDSRGEVFWAGLPGSTIGFVGKPVDDAALVETVNDVMGRPSAQRPHLKLETGRGDGG